MNTLSHTCGKINYKNTECHHLKMNTISYNVYIKSKQEMFQKHICQTYMVQNTKLLRICTRHGRNPCTKFGIDQVKGSNDIEQTTQWAEKCSLTLTFEHVT
mgnify:CR=1 FL=1